MGLPAVITVWWLAVAGSFWAIGSHAPRWEDLLVTAGWVAVLMAVLTVLFRRGR